MPCGYPRPPHYILHSDIPTEISIYIFANSNQFILYPSNSLPRPTPINPPSTVLSFHSHILFLEQPCLYFHILFHLCNTLTIDIRIHTYCTFVFVSSFLLYYIYLLFCIYSSIELLPFTPFLVILIILPLYIVVYRSVLLPFSTNNYSRY